MKLIISNVSGVPIYEQIKQQIKAAILSGELQAEETLPSLRTLLSKMPAIGKSIISVVESSPILLVFLAVFAIVVMYAVSIFLSIRIMKNKEM